MRLAGKADRLRIVGDEDGFVLYVDTDEGDSFRFNIHHLAEAFAADVDETIGDWLREAQDAATSVHPGQITVEDLDAYELNDPKRVTLEREINR